MKNWYIVQSHSSFENKVAQIIKDEARKLSNGERSPDSPKPQVIGKAHKFLWKQDVNLDIEVFKLAPKFGEYYCVYAVNVDTAEQLPKVYVSGGVLNEIVTMKQQEDDDEDEDVEDDHNPEANSPIDPHLSLARSNAIANSSFNQRQSESQQSSRDNRHMAQSQVGGPPEKTFFQSTGKAIPPAPLEHSNDDSSSVHTDSLADRFNETVIQKVFDEGKLG